MSAPVAPLPYLVFDFDSTFTQVEGLDELADIALQGHPDQAKVVGQIKALTDQGMAGEIGFQESLAKRLALLGATEQHLAPLVARLKTKVSESIQRNGDFFRRFADRIYVVSSGFREFIEPVVAEFGITADHVLANTFTFDAAGRITGCDPHNVLSRDGGKIHQLVLLDLDGPVYVLGDGYTDYQIREAGLAHRFYAYTENVARPTVVARADEVLPTFDEFLYQLKLPMTLSYPKNRIKVLLLENPDARAQELFSAEGYQVETVPGGLDEDELIQRMEGVSILGIRSKTQITKRVLAAGNRLISIGAFCIGTNQINLDEAMKKAWPCSTRPSPTPARWWSWPWAKSSCWPAASPKRTPRCTPASGTSRPGARSRFAAKRWASWATATSAPSSRWWPKPWA
jgi:D-3-phosphoglycerate dehydrogenase